MNILLFLLVLVFTPTVFAHDHLNLEHGIPLEVEDAYVTSYKNRELQGIFSYERTPEEKDLYTLTPRFEYGLFRNAQIEIASPVEFGNTDEEKTGNIDAGILYNFNMETLHIPAATFGVIGHFPTGKGTSGTDTTLKLILTKTLPVSISFHRLHVNAYWTFNSEEAPNERSGRFTGILGYQARLTTDTMLVADYFFEEELEEGKEIQLAEIGTRFQCNPLTVLAIGAGFGLTNESPDVRLTAGFQRALNLFW